MTGQGIVKNNPNKESVLLLHTWLIELSFCHGGTYDYYHWILSTFSHMYILAQKLPENFFLYFSFTNAAAFSHCKWHNRLRFKHRMQQQFLLFADSKREVRDLTLLNQHSATVFLAFWYLLSMHIQWWQAHFSSLCWMISIYENEHVRYTVSLYLTSFVRRWDHSMKLGWWQRQMVNDHTKGLL